MGTRWGKLSCDQFEVSESVYTIPAILLSSISSVFKEICLISMVKNLYDFPCFCFGLGLEPQIFTKLLKVPISILRPINIRVMIYLKDVPLIGQTPEEILMFRQSTIFLLQQPSFISSLENSFWTQFKKLNSTKMKTPLPQKKLQRIEDQF